MVDVRRAPVKVRARIRCEMSTNTGRRCNRGTTLRPVQGFGGKWFLVCNYHFARLKRGAQIVPYDFKEEQ